MALIGVPTAKIKKGRLAHLFNTCRMLSAQKKQRHAWTKILKDTPRGFFQTANDWKENSNFRNYLMKAAAIFQYELLRKNLRGIPNGQVLLSASSSQQADEVFARKNKHRPTGLETNTEKSFLLNLV